MACFHPLAAWKARTAHPSSGRRGVSFQAAISYKDRPVDLPCGRCVGCLKDRATSWSMRCEHEASLYLDNWFVTLTYSDSAIPPGGSLCPADLQNFWKRLRKAFGKGPRYYACGEYGSTTARPHYHALIFNLPLPDASLPLRVRPGDLPEYSSEQLARLWPHGDIFIGTFTPAAAAYVAKYITKRAGAEQLEGREPEFQVMSRRPGIGATWWERFHKTDMRNGVIVVPGGATIKAPRFYMSRLELRSGRRYRAARRARRAKVTPPTLEDLRRNSAKEDFQLAQKTFNDSKNRSSNPQ